MAVGKSNGQLWKDLQSLYKQDEEVIVLSAIHAWRYHSLKERLMKRGIAIRRKQRIRINRMLLRIVTLKVRATFPDLKP